MTDKTYNFKDMVDQLSYEEAVLLAKVISDKVIVGSQISGGSSIIDAKVAGKLEVIDGEIKSKNWVSNTSGWRLTPTSGEFNFAISVDLIDIPDTITTNSFHVDNTGNVWWGSTVIGTAPAKVEKDGKATFTDIVATGTINAQGGYLSAGVYIDTINGIICESGGFNVGNAGHVRGGQTDYKTGVGFFLGYSSASYKFSIKGTSGDEFYFDGVDIYLNETKLALENNFGDGSDGNVTISSDTVLTDDMFYNNLTIDLGKTLYTAGYRVFVKGVLTNNGTISRNGNNGGNGGAGTTGGSGGSPGDASTGLSSGSLYGSLAGVAGGAGGTGVNTTPKNGGNGDAGSNSAKCLGSDATNGGAGGDGGIAVGGSHGFANGTGGTAGIGGSKTGTVYNYPKNIIAVYFLYDTLPSGDIIRTNPNGGGGGGGGGGQTETTVGGAGSGGGGGGSGSGGGIVEIFAKTLINNGIISANGGLGGNGGVGGNGTESGGKYSGNGGGGAGGAGGNGGVVFLSYSKKSGAGSVTVDGGAGGDGGIAGTGGNGGVNGVDGTDGANGEIFEFVI